MVYGVYRVWGQWGPGYAEDTRSRQYPFSLVQAKSWLRGSWGPVWPETGRKSSKTKFIGFGASGVPKPYAKWLLN